VPLKSAQKQYNKVRHVGAERARNREKDGSAWKRRLHHQDEHLTRDIQRYKYSLLSNDNTRAESRLTSTNGLLRRSGMQAFSYMTRAWTRFDRTLIPRPFNFKRAKHKRASAVLVKDKEAPFNETHGLSGLALLFLIERRLREYQQNSSKSPSRASRSSIEEDLIVVLIGPFSWILYYTPVCFNENVLECSTKV
jgi:hypothetical protein